jgi:hypothetical protein
MELMASTSPTMPGKGAQKGPARMRSSLTGGFVLAPASKPGRVTIAMARRAANAVHDARNKT